MKVENVRVYDLIESLVASGYPMRTDLNDYTITEKTIKRCKALSRACDKGNGAHGQYLTGIRVAFDLTFTNKAWVEAERYRFLEFVSSQSTMHRITKFDLSKSYNEYVDPRIIAIMKDKVSEYNVLAQRLENKEYCDADEKSHWENILAKKYLEILYSNPAGFQITARITTNYRCLRNIWIQRKNHRLPEWVEFCKWIETLPMAKELICYEPGSKKDVTSEEFWDCDEQQFVSWVGQEKDTMKYRWEYQGEQNENIKNN